MADDIDQANLIIENAVSHALNKIRENAAQDGKGSKFCLECGDDIPLGRTKLGFKFCVPCAEEMERKKELFGT